MSSPKLTEITTPTTTPTTTTATTTATTTPTTTTTEQVPSILNNNNMKIGAAVVAFIIFVIILYYSFRSTPVKVEPIATEITDENETSHNKNLISAK
jgi:hypothetical protein